MNNILKGSLVLALALGALNASAGAQTAAFNALGSSAIFLELGLATVTPTTSSPAGLGVPCVWSGAGAVAKDTSTPTSLTDTGNAFVAWTTGATGGTCAAPIAPYSIYAYLQTDSVVGNRCLFNASNSATCSIAYPTTNPAPANLILSSGEIALPSAVATALNGNAVNAAGTDIRPEDAKFAMTRALAGCNAPVVTGSQYLGLGYTNGGTPIKTAVTGSTSSFNVIDFTLPASFSVTPLGATPILVVVNSPSSSSGFNDGTATTQITSATLAKFLDGTYSWTDQTASSTGTGSPAFVWVREPLSGTYNTMEYNAPNRTMADASGYTFKTSQDVGVNQPTTQVNCNGTLPLKNPLIFATTSGGARQRAIGTGQELAQISATATNSSLGYGFWSVGNFKNFTSAAAPYAKYMTIDGIDPLYTTGHTYTGTIPTTSADIANVTLNNVANGSYPMWSSLRLVNVGSSASATVTALANAAQNFVAITSTHPDFVKASNLGAVHSHFTPSGQSVVPANGRGTSTTSVCTATEAGGDVGGFVYSYTADNTWCSTHGPNGRTGVRK